MRPANQPQSALRAPLNELLATESNVRILRVLTGTRTPLSRAEVARRADLNASGVRRAIQGLIELGIVERASAGARAPVRLRRSHPLAEALESLFRAERERFDRLIAALRHAVEGLRPPPRAAWLDGPVAASADRPGDPLVVNVLSDPASIDGLAESLSDRVGDVMREHDVVIEVKAWTEADLAAVFGASRAEHGPVLPLLGPSPEHLLAPPAAPPPSAEPRGDHSRVDRRLLRFAEAIADRLERDPSLIERAREHLSERLQSASPGERRELAEWRRLLASTSVQGLRRLLTDPGERSTRLRQTMPFLDALTDEERKRILEEAE